MNYSWCGFSDSQRLGSICKTGLGFLVMCVTLLTMLKCTFDCFSILKTVQPEDLTNQTRVLESIERVLESLTEKTSNWKYKDMNIDSISEIAVLNAPSSSHNIGHVEMNNSPLSSCQTGSMSSVYYSTFPTHNV